MRYLPIGVRIGRRGATVVLVALSIISLLGFTGLAVDVGHWYHVRARLQSYADSAAMAGCFNLATGTALAESEARRYAALNFVAAADVEVARAVGGNRFEVVLKREAGPFFSSVLGISRLTIRARAVAEATNSAGAGTPGSAGTATLSSIGFNFGIFSGRRFTSGSSTYTANMSGSENRVECATHFNGGFSLGGASNQFPARVSAGTSVTNQGNDSLTGGITNGAAQVTMPTLDTAALSSNARTSGKYFKHISGSTWQKFNPATGTFVAASNADLPTGGSFSSDKIVFGDSNINITGTFYVENGHVEFSGSSMTGGATVYADKTISFNGSDNTFTDGTGFAFISNFSASASGDPAIKIEGSKNQFNAVFFAPRGPMQLSGSENVINGSMIADSYGDSRLSGSKNVIRCDDDPLTKVPVVGPTPATIRHVKLIE